MKFARRRSSAVAVVLLAACAPNADVAADTAAPDAAGAPVTPPDSTELRASAETLRSFLDASREGSSTRDSVATLTACDDGGATAPGPMLATFQLLPATSRGDTVVGRAVVTTVADQDVDRQHPGYFIARIRVRSDTLEWDILRSASGGLVVCNGLRFGITAPDSLTSWRPNGATAARARALADSVGARK